MSHGNLGDEHTIRHFGKMSSYTSKKNRQTRVSLAMWGVGDDDGVTGWLVSRTLLQESFCSQLCIFVIDILYECWIAEQPVTIVHIIA